MLILNHYGLDMVNSLTQAVQFGMRDRQANGKDFQIVMPLFSELMAKGAGENVKGIFGTSNWHWNLQDAGSIAFTKSFGAAYGSPPSQAAHTAYVQALLYADAVRTRRHLLSARSHQGAGRPRVRRHGQWSDAVPRRRPPVHQVGARGAGQ